jgi:quercetin dioxygenase-like cupin family protein
MTNELIEIKQTELAQKLEYREQIQNFEDMLSQQPEATFGNSPLAPLVHMFAPGIYVRQITLPKDSICVGKIHKYEHPNFLMSGKVKVVTEDGGYEILEAPMVMISPAGTKRAVHALEDTVWVTVHATNETDLEKIEDEVIAKSYEELPTNKESLCLG